MSGLLKQGMDFVYLLFPTVFSNIFYIGSSNLVYCDVYLQNVFKMARVWQICLLERCTDSKSKQRYD